MEHDINFKFNFPPDLENIIKIRMHVRKFYLVVLDIRAAAIRVRFSRERHSVTRARTRQRPLIEPHAQPLIIICRRRLCFTIMLSPLNSGVLQLRRDKSFVRPGFRGCFRSGWVETFLRYKTNDCCLYTSTLRTL